MSDPHIVKSLQWRLDRALGRVDALEFQLAEAKAEAKLQEELRRGMASECKADEREKCSPIGAVPRLRANEKLAGWAYNLADAMMVKRSKTSRTRIQDKEATNE